MCRSNLLLPADPIGLDSPEVESIGSFLLRLADINGASPLKIVKWIANRHQIPEIAKSILASPPVTLCRPTNLNRRFLEILARSTGFAPTILSRMTFLSLDNVVNRGADCFDKHWKWCPSCFSETASNDGDGYFRLLWSLTGMTHCPIHHIALQNRCYACHALQNGWRRRHELHTCINCGASLEYTDSALDREYSWEFGAADLVDLVDVLAMGEGNRFCTDGPRKALDIAFDSAWARNEELEYYKKLPRDECLAYLHCNKPITLTTARRLAHRTGIPLVQMLRGVGKESTRELKADWRSKLPYPLTPKRRRRRMDIILVRRELEIVEHSPGQPSLRRVAERLGVSTGGLVYHFPKQCKSIVKQYKQRCLEEQQEKSENVHLAVRDAITQWKRTRLSAPSKKGLLKMLYPYSRLPKNMLREEISNVFNCVNERYT